MGSKAKSGLSPVRQWAEDIQSSLEADYVDGALTYSLQTIDAKGMSKVRAGVSNDATSPGTLQILQSFRSSGGFIEVAAATTLVDPTTGFHVRDLDVPITRRYVIVRFVPDGAPGLTAAFELGAHLLPIG